MTVIEARGRGGQLLERFRSRNSIITIGRAFDNDFILEDEFISGHQLRLSAFDRGWRFEDIGSRNGLKHGGRNVRDGVLHSGDELRIGHTTLHIYADTHPVEPALKLDGAEARLSALGRHGVWLLLLAVSLIVVAVAAYWDTYEEFKPLTMLEPVLSAVLGLVLIAAFWASLGRLLRHKAYFFVHLSVWLLFFLLSALGGFLVEALAYNLQSQPLEMVLENILGLCALALAVWASFTLATSLRGRGRVFAALGVAALFLAVGLSSQFRFDREFSNRPDYYAELKAPALRFVQPVEEQALLDRLPQIFDSADEEIEAAEQMAATDPDAGDFHE